MLEAVTNNEYTKDLAILATGKHHTELKEGSDYMVTEAFMDAVDNRFRAKWN